MDKFTQRRVARRFEAALTPCQLPEMTVDLGTWKRLQAMRERIEPHDPELAGDPDAMQHVVYAAIVRGLDHDEKDAGVTYDGVTGERVA